MLLGNNIPLKKYRGISLYEVRPLANKDNFGPHWNGYLNDDYRINQMWIFPVESIAKDLNGQSASPKNVQVVVQSVQHPKFWATTTIDNFL